MTRHAPIHLALAALLMAASTGGCSCSDDVDKAAKQRIFSPEDPPKVIASAAEKLPPEEVADRPELARRILGMDAAELTERLGPHRYGAQVTFEWSSGERTVKLSEERTLLAGRGGVAGDFHGTVTNSRDQGLEVLRVHGDVYAKNRHGKFRHRRRDRGMAERARSEIQGAMRELDWLFRGRMKLTPAGTASYEGRTVWRYELSLAPAAADGLEAAGAEGTGLPPVQSPKGGFDETTRRRQAFQTLREPRSLSGEVLVDAETSVVLKARLDGRVHVPDSNDAAAPADLRVTLSSKVDRIGREPGLKTPADFLPDADKPEGIADALDRFGIPHESARGTDAGTPSQAAAPAPEPEDE